MPVHAAAWALSSLLTVGVLIRTALAIVVLAVLRQGAHGLDPNRLLDRLIADAQTAERDEDQEEDAEEARRRKDAGHVESEAETLRRLRLDAASARKAKGRRKVAPVRDLHGRVFLLASGALDTPVGLQLADALVRRGAQLVLLDPRPLSHPAVLQLVHLLRSASGHGGDGDDADASGIGNGGENQLVYAEQCDLADLRSVEAFVKKWETLLKPGGSGGSGARGTDGGPTLDPRTAPRTDGVDAGSLQAMAASSPARRLDSIIFLPPSSTYSFGARRDSVRYPSGKPASSKAKTKSSDADTTHVSLEIETEHALALGRIHLILALVPSLTTLPRERDIRIVTAVGPWYAAASALVSRIPRSGAPHQDGRDDTDSVPAGFTSSDLDWQASPSRAARPSLRFSRWSPHLPRALTDLTWLALSTYLQRRLDVLAGELSATSSGAQSVGEPTEAEMAARKSRSNIRVLTVSLGFERAASFASFLPSSAGRLHTVWLFLRALIWLALQPLALLLLRSSTHAANEVLWAIRAPIRAGWELLPSPETRLDGVEHEQEGSGGAGAGSGFQLRKAEAVIPGKLHYQGDVVRTPLPPALQDEKALRALYRQEEARARAILAQAAPLPTSAAD
ncbi:hypothetical protein OC834_005536 [Tilletia horrida]|nr:hypothetical protein OC834_005536 [Tilletia horrida]